MVTSWNEKHKNFLAGLSFTMAYPTLWVVNKSFRRYFLSELIAFLITL
jgi:hypothetical protein